MKWYEIAVYTTDAGAEPVCGALTSAGLSGFSIEESRESAAAFLKESALYWDFADMDKIGADTPCVKAYLAVLPENEPVLDAARAVVYDALKRSPFAGSPKKRPKKRSSSFKRSNNSDRDRAANAETHRARALGFRANTISPSISFHNPDRLR